MKKFSIFAALMALVMIITSLGASVSALSWKDGALAHHSFTYAAADEGVASVKVWDKNGTASGEVSTGKTVTVKAGTISWRDSYLTATAFYVKNNTGYKTVKVLIDGAEGKFFSAKETNKVTATSDLRSGAVYTLPVYADYDDVFYFCRAGKEAWNKDASFEIVTEKIVYTFADANGETVGTGKVNEEISLTAEGRWFLGDKEILPGTVLTADMITAYAEGSTITLRKYTEPKPLVTDVTVTVHTDRSSNAASNTVVIRNAEIGSVLDLSTNEATQQFIAQGYKIAGDADYQVTVSKDLTVKLVKATSVSGSASSTEYGIYFRSADENILRVDFESSSGIKGIDLKTNEMLKFYTSAVGNNYHNTMSLFVKVAKGYALDTSVLEDAKVYSSDDEGTTYILSFERTGRHDNPENIGKADCVTIDLKTIAK